MKKIIISSSIVLLFVLYSFSGAAQTHSLKGCWLCSNKETENGEDGRNTTLSGEEYKCTLLLKFLDDKEVIYEKDNKNSVKVEYHIENDNLTIGSKIYVIEKHTPDSLVLLEKNQGLLYSPNLRFYLKKCE